MYDIGSDISMGLLIEPIYNIILIRCSNTQIIIAETIRFCRSFGIMPSIISISKHMSTQRR